MRSLQKQFFVAGVAALLVGCSDLKQPVPANLDPDLSVHPSGWVDDSSQQFHGLFLASIQWDLGNCRECHGDDYTGGIANSSCITCHAAGPEDCVVCHGGTDNATGAPPEDLFGNIATTARGVGAHTAHLSGKSLSAGFECETCHLVPTTFDAAGHVDSELPAEVLFSNLALTDSAAPVWNSSSTSCSESYCHGNWSLAKEQSNSAFIYADDVMQGNNATPTWTDPESAACGTCHGLPPTGHTPFELNACANCHAAVVDSDGNIIDATKHVNGQINVFGQEFPMF